MKITIIVVDDHELVRKSIVSLLRVESDFDVVGECADGREALELVARMRPMVAVIDVAMPELNGIEAAQRLRSLSPATRVIALSNYTDEAYVCGMLNGGAVGYIVKSGAARDLIDAVRFATRGKIYLSAEVQALAHRASSSAVKGGTAASYNPLSPREREVLQLIGEGRTSKGIARTLCISETTVKTHRNHIMEKLDIHDTAGLTRHAIRLGLVHLTSVAALIQSFLECLSGELNLFISLS